MNFGEAIERCWCRSSVIDFDVEQLENTLSPEHMRALEDAVKRTSKATIVEVSATHTRKYNQLNGNNKASSTNLANKDKWVKNISKRT